MTVTSAETHAAQGPQETLRMYVDALIRQDWETARACWLPQQVKQSERLGVRYQGVPAKYDCASPLIEALQGIRTGDITYTITSNGKTPERSTHQIQLTADNQQVDVEYDLIRTEAGWRIVSRLWLEARDYQSIDTRFVRVHFKDSSWLNDYALQELDRFVDSLAGVFGLTSAQREYLEDKKLYYYICDKDALEAISGFPIHGMTSLPFDAVVTRHLPHYHELVHAMVNYAQQTPSLHTLPCLQEGLAVALGGRWEKSPRVLLQLGEFMLREDFAKPEEILSYDGFHYSVGSLDISYALSGLLTGYLIERIGIDRIMQLYASLSGNNEKVQSFSADGVQARIAEKSGLSWSEIKAGLSEYVAPFATSGLTAGIKPASDTPTETLQTGLYTVRVWDEDSILHLEGQFQENHVSSGALLLYPSEDSLPTAYHSRLFAKHFSDIPYDGAAYAVLFDAGEAGLYDYRTGLLLAKYVLSFAPSPEYWNPESLTLRFQLDPAVLPYRFDSLVLRAVER